MSEKETKRDNTQETEYQRTQDISITNLSVYCAFTRDAFKCFVVRRLQFLALTSIQIPMILVCQAFRLTFLNCFLRILSFASPRCTYSMVCTRSFSRPSMSILPSSRCCIIFSSFMTLQSVFFTKTDNSSLARPLCFLQCGFTTYFTT
jgi:hypothetical protein